MRTKTTTFLGALLLTSTAFAQVNDADSTSIHGAAAANWQGLTNHPTSNPGLPPVYELPPEQPPSPEEPLGPTQPFDCSAENGCLTPEQACALGGDMYCQPETKPMHCGLDNGCVDQQGEDAMLCASGFTEYCK